jgi:hypothetical protein
MLAHPLGHRWARRLTVATLAMGSVLSAAAGVSELWSWPEAAFAAFLFAASGLAVGFAPARAPTWTSWAGCAAVVFLVLGIGQRTWLPDYHQRFGLRRQVEISSAYEQEEELPIVTFPKRWDSVSYYMQRDDVESYQPANFAQMWHDLHKHGKSLIFVRREESLRDLMNAMPDHLELVMLGRKEDYVMVALVQPRK